MPPELSTEEIEKEIHIINEALGLLVANHELNTGEIQTGKYLPQVFTRLQMVYLPVKERLEEERLGYEHLRER